MSPMSILMLLVGVWVLINALNGNLPGLVNGTIKFNTPGTNTAPLAPNQVLGPNGTISTQATGNANNPAVPPVVNGQPVSRPGAPF